MSKQHAPRLARIAPIASERERISPDELAIFQNVLGRHAAQSGQFQRAEAAWQQEVAAWQAAQGALQAVQAFICEKYKLSPEHDHLDTETGVITRASSNGAT